MWVGVDDRSVIVSSDEIAISVIAWYVLDTFGSLLANSLLNILLNTSILILALPPIIANRKAIVNGIRNLS